MWYVCDVDRDTVAMVTIILCFYSSYKKSNPLILAMLQIKNEDATSDHDHTLSMLMTVDT